MAVNLAGLLPGDTAFRTAVTDAVSDAGLEWDRLVLELVETSLVALPPPASLERYTELTITDPGALRAELAQVRADGYATAVAELEEGLVAVAARS